MAETEIPGAVTTAPSVSEVQPTPAPAPEVAAVPAASPSEPHPADTPTLLEGATTDRPLPGDAKPEEPKPAAPEAAKVEAKPAEPAKTETPPAQAQAPEPITYEFALPEVLKDDGKSLDEYRNLLGSHRVAPEAGQKLLDLHAKAMTDYSEHLQNEQRRVWNETRDTWRKEVLADEQLGGAGHQTAMAAIARVRDVAVPEAERASFEAFLRTTGAGDNPAFLRAMHRLARYIDEPQSDSIPSNPKPAPDSGRPRGRFRDAMYDNPRSTPGGRG
jgi:hypothetical protein